MMFEGTLERTQALPLVDALLEAGANVNFQKPDRGETALIGAASLGAEDVGLRLLDAGADPHRLGLFGETALHWASMMGEDRLVDRLLEKGTSANEKDRKYHATPLGWALHGWADPTRRSHWGYYDVVRRLVAAGASVDAGMISAEVRADPAMLSALMAEG
jgi:ankyrin repeat protein